MSRVWPVNAYFLARKIFFYFSRSPPPRATCIIPDARPLGTFENQDGRN